MLPKALVAASLKPMIFSLLSNGEMYGYEVIERVRTLSDGKINWTANKIYPLLHGFENEALVEASWKPSTSGPARKYYRLTAKGQLALDAERSSWREINAVLVQLWTPELNMST